MTEKIRRSLARAVFIGPILALALAACSTGGFSAFGGPKKPDDLYAPGVNPRAEAVDGIEVGHRLIAAGQYELAIKSFNRAALDHGLTGEILSALGSANLGLGRLGQAETLLRRAVEKDAAEPEVWNNLGVVLMESGQTAEAEQIFRKAYALDNGESDAIRDNLRLALAKTEKYVITEVNEDNYKLVRRGSGDYLIRPTP
ncbi:tetratricopeptide repeat protein [Sulfitobacter dubius]|uniref:tetratricopeptide repeat protein n=1 Tax=Sulfitobacter dubius TaxID=218673 RepID=UPI0008EB22CD|nr:tetratricopeptide repeat protein [Sulfitobacter dubius]SFG61926.1 TPR repeat-containing protein [Sulfitobacter dubius]